MALPGGCDRSDAIFGRFWLEILQDNVPQDANYVGNSLTSANLMSTLAGKKVWEHKNHPGYYVVSENFPDEVDFDKSKWNCYKDGKLLQSF